MSEKAFVNQLRDREILTNKEKQEIFFNVLMDDINNLLFNPKSVVSSILEEESSEGSAANTFRIITYAWLPTLAKLFDDERFDGRNEYACKIGKKLYEIPEIQELVMKSTTCRGRYDFSNLPTCFRSLPEDIGGFVAKNMANEHRTLQQTFSSLVFTFLMAEWNNSPEILEVIRKNGVEEYSAECPFI